MIDLSIIIVNYNVKEFLQNLFASIEKAAQNLSHEIIVVDNASDDGSRELLDEKYPDVKLIANKKNVGFGVANNQGLEIAKGKYILLINPDTIVKEDTFTSLIKFFENNPDAGMAGCKVLNPDGTLQLACRRSFPGPWVSFTKVAGLSKIFPKSKLFAQYNLTYLDENQSYEVDAISGAFMMMRKETYEKVGGFDPQFFMYGEDLDLCYRIKSAGFKVYYVHETEIIHYKGESTKRSSIDETKVFYDAMMIFVRKHLSSSLLVKLILQFAILLRQTLAFINVYRLVIISIFIDLVLFNSAIYAAEKLYNPGSWPGFPEYVKPWIYFVPSLIQIIISALGGAYGKKTLSVLRVLVSLFVGLIFISSITFFFKQFAFSRAIVLITYGFLIILYPLWRIISKVVFKVGLIHETKKYKTIIVGTDQKARKLFSAMKSTLVRVHNVLGFVSYTHKEVGEKIDNIEVIGSVENLKRVIKENHVDKVIFSSNEISFNKIFSIVSQCQGENVEFLLAGNELDYLVGKSAVTMLDDIALLKVQYNISAFTHSVIKSVFDISISIIILLLVYPFLFLADKLGKRKTDFSKFILGTPSVLFRKKSFVGPRDESFHNGLFIGKIGLTGLWYTEEYNHDDATELNNLDVYYAKNQNIWLDLEILGKSFSKMFIN
ncbi:MAG: glycosyltransferase [Melioribacteraceae bacterium]|nr:glycosyltransferase [Melioribacteraceae bacterium]MCF8393838.1 glycosyltransferase [Melioribacteraceae bacterium]MCF8418211.1 glycosyltransferase [Melioribacteraceae bacterium]